MNPQDVTRTISQIKPKINHLSHVQYEAESDLQNGDFDSPERMKSFFEHTRNREGTASDISLKHEDEDKKPQLKVIEDDYSDRM